MSSSNFIIVSIEGNIGSGKTTLMTHLKEEYKKVEIEKFFALTTLAFDEDIQRDFGKKPEFDKIKINDLTLTVPKITITKYGIS